MAASLDSNILSQVDIILPKNAVESCYKLKIGHGAEFLSTNIHTRTVSRMKLFKRQDECVKISLIISRLQITQGTSLQPDHILVHATQDNLNLLGQAAEQVKTGLEKTSNPVPVILNSTEPTAARTDSCNSMGQVANSLGLSSHKSNITTVPTVYDHQSKTINTPPSLTTSEESSSTVKLQSNILSTESPTCNVEQTANASPEVSVLQPNSSLYYEILQLNSNPNPQNPGPRLKPDRKRKLPDKYKDSLVDISGKAISFGEKGVVVDTKRAVLMEPVRKSRIKRVELESIPKAGETPCETMNTILSAGSTLHEVETEDLGGECNALSPEKETQEVQGVQKEDSRAEEAKSVARLEQMAKRRRKHYKREPNVLCGFCDSKLKDYGGLYEHLRMMHSGEPGFESCMNQVKKMMRVKCPECGKFLSKKEQLAQHMKVMHSTLEPAFCPECGLKVKSEAHVVAHYKRCHDEKARKAMYLCDQCPASFRHKAYLSSHLANVHNTSKIQLNCDLCGKKYRSKKYLVSHKRRVHGAKRHHCKYCNMGFTTSGNLKRHVDLIHERPHQRPFSCQQCDKQFALKGNLLIHIKNVHERIYKMYCDVCQAGFQRKTHLKIHLQNVHGPGGPSKKQRSRGKRSKTTGTSSVSLPQEQLNELLKKGTLSEALSNAFMAVNPCPDVSSEQMVLQNSNVITVVEAPYIDSSLTGAAEDTEYVVTTQDELSTLCIAFQDST